MSKWGWPSRRAKATLASLLCSELERWLPLLVVRRQECENDLSRPDSTYLILWLSNMGIYVCKNHMV
jgi:hypothetical protein